MTIENSSYFLEVSVSCVLFHLQILVSFYWFLLLLTIVEESCYSMWLVAVSCR